MSLTASTIIQWLDRILNHEGGFTNDPADPGNWTGGAPGKGELKGTKYGIAANTYGHLDIANLTIEQAAEIYRRDFLAPLQAVRYADGVAYQLLDFAVNSGIGRAVRGLQRELGLVDDGAIGPKTIAAVGQRSESDLIMLVLANRLEFMTGLRNWPHSGKGWALRLARDLRYGAMDSD